MQRADNDLTDAEWVALVDAWGGCAYCGASGVPLQRDCVLALSRGGRYTLTNIVPACRSCNASKSNDEVTSWMRRRKLDERSFLTRHYQLSANLAASLPASPDPTAAPDLDPAAAPGPGPAEPAAPDD